MSGSIEEINPLMPTGEINHAAAQAAPSAPLKKPSMGYFPEVILGSSFGLLSIAVAFTNPMDNTTWANILYWLGLLILIIPIAIRLLSLNVSRNERIGLIIFLGLSFYLIKLMHSPYMFTYSDELLHLRNAINIQQSMALFGENSILPVSAYYPGLEIITTAISTLTGMSLFASGLLLIGISRLIIILSLYFLYELVSCSSHLAGVAVLLYMANSNFLYWSAQYSYESLSLPLAILVLFVLAKHDSLREKELRRGLVIIMFLLIAAIISTHHVTSYGLITLLIGLSIVYTVSQIISKKKLPNTWGFALVTAVLTFAWLFLVASRTKSYLYQIFGNAFASVLQLFTGEQTGRVLFTSTTGTIAPLWERSIGIASVLLLIIGISSGIITLLWIRNKFNSFSIVLTNIALIYFVTLVLRFTGGGWEVANRSSEFLFIGIAFLIAFVFVTLRIKFPRNILLPAIFVGYTGTVIFGGIIAGWPPALRLSQPLVISVNHTTVIPQGLDASSWLSATGGQNNIVIAPASDALLMLTRGHQRAFTGKIYSISELLTQPHTLEWQTDILQTIKARFVVMDQRRVSWDGMMGMYFTPQVSSSPQGAGLFPSNIFDMFETAPQVPRIYDSGEIAIYDVRSLSGLP